MAYDATRLHEICTRHRIRAIRVFGSVLRPDFGPASDLDLLIEFDAGVDPDLFELGGLQQELSALFGRTVDLKTHDMFSPANLGRVLATSALGYAA
jgi:predicted nucleotidyltransferase